MPKYGSIEEGDYKDGKIEEGRWVKGKFNGNTDQGKIDT